jgi:uncharacterized protein (DUF1501 family)
MTHHAHSPRLSRRAALFTLGSSAAWPLESALAMQPDTGLLKRKRLVLFRLHGGNDGLNTLVPYRDPLYRKLRPTLAQPLDKLLPVSDELALHPRLTEFMKMFQAGEVSIVQDVGYPDPNLSHFESAAIWDSGDPKESTQPAAGWWGKVAIRNRAAFDASRFDAAAVTFDRNTAFGSGQGVPVLWVDRDAVATLEAKGAKRVRAALASPRTTRAIADMINDGIDMRARFAKRLRGISPPEWESFEEPFDLQAKLTEWFLSHGVATPLVRVSQDGFDTHALQLARHDELLKAFDSGLARLKQGLKAAGVWNDTVIMVHSEFGRRPAENGYGGTDHGTAGPVFLIGGKVGGGIHGQRALLSDLDREGNLKFTTDLRAVYSTLVTNLWELPGNPFAADGFAPLPLRLV